MAPEASCKATQARCKIVEHAEVAPRTRRLVLEAPDLARECAPGQFVHVLCVPVHKGGAAVDPLLRRPFSIHDAHPSSGYVVLLYEVRGRGTAALAALRPGEAIDVLGPLGQGFVVPESRGRPLLTVAGGVGVAPIYFLARRIGERIGCDGTTSLVGARTADMLLCLGGLAALGGDVRVATDDGTAGYQGFVTGLLQEYIQSAVWDKADPPLVFACGPMAMLKSVAEITRARGLECQVSVEAKMACGVGACMSCAVKVRSGDSFRYVRACKEGPVFDADEIVWE